MEIMVRDNALYSCSVQIGPSTRKQKMMKACFIHWLLNYLYQNYFKYYINVIYVAGEKGIIGSVGLAGLDGADGAVGPKGVFGQKVSIIV